MYNATTLALESKLYPGKVMFEGANKNLIVYTQRNLKIQRFAFSGKYNAWYNAFTLRSMMLQNADES